MTKVVLLFYVISISVIVNAFPGTNDFFASEIPQRFDGDQLWRINVDNNVNKENIFDVIQDFGNF